jgi:hypothetical protein
MTLEREQLVSAIRAFIGALRETASFGPKAVTTIVETLDKLAAYFEHNEVDHVIAHAALRSMLASLETALGGGTFGQFATFGRKWVVRQMMPRLA